MTAEQLDQIINSLPGDTTMTAAATIINKMASNTEDTMTNAAREELAYTVLEWIEEELTWRDDLGNIIDDAVGRQWTFDYTPVGLVPGNWIRVSGAEVDRGWIEAHVLPLMSK